MRLQEHLVISGALSSAFYAAGHSVPFSLGVFLAGFLIDLDHAVDYLRENYRQAGIPHFFRTCEEYRLQRVYLWLHSIEILLVAGAVAWITRNGWLLGLVVGGAQHLLLDQLSNRTVPGTYFFFYRWKKRFVSREVFDMTGGGGPWA